MEMVLSHEMEFVDGACFEVVVAQNTVAEADARQQWKLGYGGNCLNKVNATGKEVARFVNLDSIMQRDKKRRR
jgi:hypothetical protein